MRGNQDRKRQSDRQLIFIQSVIRRDHVEEFREDLFLEDAVLPTHEIRELLQQVKFHLDETRENREQGRKDQGRDSHTCSMKHKKAEQQIEEQKGSHLFPALADLCCENHK